MDILGAMQLDTLKSLCSIYFTTVKAHTKTGTELHDY